MVIRREVDQSRYDIVQVKPIGTRDFRLLLLDHESSKNTIVLGKSTRVESF